jgi:hypothetical protein
MPTFWRNILPLETLAYSQKTAQCTNPEDHHLCAYIHENVKSYMLHKFPPFLSDKNQFTAVMNVATQHAHERNTKGTFGPDEALS